MKAKIFAILTTVFLSVPVLAGCLPGNVQLTVEWGDGTVDDACCVEVGDGSALSCTNGEIWFNVFFVD